MYKNICNIIYFFIDKPNKYLYFNLNFKTTIKNIKVFINDNEFIIVEQNIKNIRKIKKC
ncbi:hypothetical protein UT300019_27910 [Clostridium sp. CTA-19]